MMNFITKVGNLKLYYEQERDFIQPVYFDFLQEKGKNFTPAAKIYEFAKKYHLNTYNRYGDMIVVFPDGDEAKYHHYEIIEKDDKTEKVTIYLESICKRLVIYVINGCDIVERMTFTDATPESACRCADITLQRLDIVTLDVITAALPKICREYGGRLLSGEIAGFSKTAYFKQFPDNPRYYKHYVDRPAM